MADAVDVAVIRNTSKYYTVHLVNKSDGTGESGVVKVDISGLTAANGNTCLYTTVDHIFGSAWGGSVQLYWDHSTDDEIANISGFVNDDWSYEGGKTDPRSSGGTGDIILTTTGFVSGSGYDLTIRLKKKS